MNAKTTRLCCNKIECRTIKQSAFDPVIEVNSVLRSLFPRDNSPRTYPAPHGDSIYPFLPRKLNPRLLPQICLSAYTRNKIMRGPCGRYQRLMYGLRRGGQFPFLLVRLTVIYKVGRFIEIASRQSTRISHADRAYTPSCCLNPKQSTSGSAVWWPEVAWF